MKILIDLQHPAHLHFFRNAIHRLRRDGHTVILTGRDKDILVALARTLNMEIEVFGVAKKGVFNLGKELLYRQYRLMNIIRKFKPDVMMAIAGTYISALGKLFRIPVYIFYDTEHATLSNWLAYPFATCIYVPRCYRKSIRWNHVRYNGYHEIAYLHPQYFQPDPTVLEEVGVKPGETFTLIRLVGWGASHDIGRSGLSRENKIRAVHAFSDFGKVFISSEGELPSELEPYRLKLDIHKIHHLMAYAALIFGESATMASEGAVLGVPGVYIDPVGRGYTDEEEREYGIVFNFSDRQQDEALRKGCSILAGYPEDREKWKAVGRQITGEKIDVTDLIYRVATKTYE
ncbi:MAG: DUF354 domain-containing protein [Candidatus Omnitrophota bacterium]